ncbi:MAG: FAD-dependent oxidoreductase [Elusimicrobiota bacterium]|nr:FAD-dependent oxidoreductase [Elusimicrobiota bacterium]
MRVAVIGSGVAGIVSAWELSKAGWEVALYEKERRLGGHTHTVVVEDGPDAGTPVDTGFIVCNDRTYPGFHRFLAELGVGWRWSDMSFGYHDENSGLQYAGTGPSGLFAQRSNLLSPAYWRLLAGIVRFNAPALKDLERGAFSGLTLGEYLARRGFARAVVEHYVLPIGAAIWSTGLDGMRDFPAEAFVRFFKNHGLLSLTDRVRWQTVVGGSHAYLKAFRARFPGEVLSGAPVESLRRLAGGGVEVTARGSAPRVFDRAVVAAHADEALALLADPSPEERELLGAWSYSKNRVLLHTDASFLPADPRARASWNYRRVAGEDGSGPASLTYDMNRLQGLKAAKTWLVTLNPRREPAPGALVRELAYAHPTYTFRSLRTQARLPSLNGRRSTWFCGSYFGSGFHEDAVRSALAVARDFAAVPQEALS